MIESRERLRTSASSRDFPDAGLTPQRQYASQPNGKVIDQRLEGGEVGSAAHERRVTGVDHPALGRILLTAEGRCDLWLLKAFERKDPGLTEVEE